MERIYTKGIPKDEGKKVKLAGWVDEIRLLGKLNFVILRDREGKVQIIVKRGEVEDEIFKRVKDLTKESVILVEGKVKLNEEAPGGLEIVPEKLEILSKAEVPLPIDFSGKVNTTLDKRLDWRFLDLRNPKIDAIFKVQSEIARTFREFFRKRGFTEFWPPEIIEAAPEGGAELFKIKYFERDAYLAQSPELYKELATGTNLERVFTIVPVWRAEKHDTPKHLNEIRQMDIEAAFEDQFSIMKYLEDVVKYIVESVLKNCTEEIELLNPELEVPKTKYLSYDEVIEILNENNLSIKYGEDLNPEAEKKLAEIYGKNMLIFIHSWPIELKPFYIMPKDEKMSNGFDADYGGIEISSGGQRVHRPEILIKHLKAKGLDPEQFKFFLNSLKYGIPPHAGWSIGLERLTMVLCNLKNIREATMYPRDRNRLIP
ncbi:MAG: aspartate--tRNA(Asn) ligase [Candidatus Aenigmarchaeota archaeon]|nr:aspartate--tRNA(Asn) ligase [Candidatus Aenigmarchaeota archaeon]